MRLIQSIEEVYFRRQRVELEAFRCRHIVQRSVHGGLYLALLVKAVFHTGRAAWRRLRPQHDFCGPTNSRPTRNPMTTLARARHQLGYWNNGKSRRQAKPFSCQGESRPAHAGGAESSSRAAVLVLYLCTPTFIAVFSNWSVLPATGALPSSKTTATRYSSRSSGLFTVTVILLQCFRLRSEPGRSRTSNQLQPLGPNELTGRLCLGVATMPFGSCG